MKADEIRELIHNFLSEELNIEDDIDNDTALMKSGLLDSADVIRLAALLEDELGISIPDRDVTPEHFDTLEQILAYVETRARPR